MTATVVILTMTDGLLNIYVAFFQMYIKIHTQREAEKSLFCTFTLVWFSDYFPMGRTETSSR